MKSYGELVTAPLVPCVSAVQGNMSGNHLPISNARTYSSDTRDSVFFNHKYMQ